MCVKRCDRSRRKTEENSDAEKMSLITMIMMIIVRCTCVDVDALLFMVFASSVEMVEPKTNNVRQDMNYIGKITGFALNAI